MPEDPTIKAGRDRTATLPNSASEARVIGHYRLLRSLGEGGMGEVWEAEQTEPVQRRVALKLIKRGMDSAQVIARFESERQALALMDHSAIAKVYDAGTTERGRPYFVMELVHGVPITEYCDRHRMTVRQRLELFIQVCEGIQHAHQKAIIHRDVKPTNILIAEQDSSPVPKIIDFGVAKATAQRLTERTLFTELGQLIGTPEYMSPEQAELTGEDIDIRTDVYSLGMVLYELLVGALPFDPKELRQAGLLELQRKIREDEPARPSTQITRMGDASTTAAQNRSTTPLALVKSLKGDLDWIVLKALDRDRNRRYETAHALAQDLDRFQQHQPVEARPPNAAYRVRKYIRRHTLGVIAASLILIALVLGLLVATAGLVRARRAETHAAREAQTAREVSDFLEDILEVSDPSEARGNSITVREVLDKGLEEISTGLVDQPQIRANLLGVMGRVYQNLGLYDAALPILREALDLREKALGRDHLETLTALLDLANLHWYREEFDAAEPLYIEVVEGRQASLGQEHPETLSAMWDLASNLFFQGQKQDALEMTLQVLEIQKRVLGDDHNDTIQTKHNLAAFYWSLGRYDDAEAINLEVLAGRTKNLGHDHPLTLNTSHNLGTVYVRQGRFDEAEGVLSRTVQQHSEVLGPLHPRTLRTKSYLAIPAAHLGQQDRAFALLSDWAEGGYPGSLTLDDPLFDPIRDDPRFQTLLEK